MAKLYYVVERNTTSVNSIALNLLKYTKRRGKEMVNSLGNTSKLFLYFY